MKMFAVVLFIVASVSARGSGPYLPSGWRPQGPAFYLPSELKPSSESPKEVILEGSEASGSDFLREYGPPIVQEVSQNLISQGLPDVDVEQSFGAQIEIKEEAVVQQAEIASEANVEQSSEAVTASFAEEKSTVSEPLVEVSEISQNAGDVEVNNVEILQSEDVVSSEGSTESVVNESSEANLLAIEESQSTPADVLVSQVSELSQLEAEPISQVSEVSQVEAEQVSQVSEVSQVEAEQVSQVSEASQVEAEQVSQVEVEPVSQVSQVQEISEQVSQESSNLEAVSQQEQKQEVNESQSNDKSELSQSELSQAVGLVSAQNIPDIIASIENEVKVLQSEVSQAVSDVSVSGALEQEPVGFLEYGPPGFAEYGPPKGAAEEEEKPALQSIKARRRRFSPKFRLSKKH